MSARGLTMIRAAVGAAAALGCIALGGAAIMVTDAATANGMSRAQGLLQFLSYFTILTNIFAVAVLIASLIKSDAKTILIRPSAAAAAAVYLASVGLFYALALRGFWNPRGWFEHFIDSILHDIMPVVFVLWWLIRVPRGTLRATDPLVWLIFPLGYWVLIFVSGAIAGVYPYPLVDVARVGPGRALAGAALHLASILLLGALAFTFDRCMAPGSVGKIPGRTPASPLS